MPHGAITRQLATSAMHQSTAQCPLILSDGQLVDERREHTFADRVPVGPMVIDCKPLRLRHTQKLLQQGGDLPRRTRVDAQATTGVQPKSVLLCIVPGPHEDEKVRIGPIAQQILTGLSHGFGRTAYQ